MKFAMFKYVKYGIETVGNEELEKSSKYVRLTEYVEVEFIPLDYKSVTTQEVAILEGAKKELKKEYHNKKSDIERKIGELLALPEPE